MNLKPGHKKPILTLALLDSDENELDYIGYKRQVFELVRINELSFSNKETIVFPVITNFSGTIDKAIIFVNDEPKHMVSMSNRTWVSAYCTVGFTPNKLYVNGLSQNEIDFWFDEEEANIRTWIMRQVMQ